MVRSEDGFTVLEMLAVLTIMAILVAIALGFSTGARVRAADATARSNIDVATPAFQAFHADNGTYVGITLGGLQSSYSKGIQGIEIVSAAAAGYCVKSTVNGRSWFKSGPSGPITTTSCS